VRVDISKCRNNPVRKVIKIEKAEDNPKYGYIC